jgi:peptidoglycan hydrolase CwlO-like protein
MQNLESHSASLDVENELFTSHWNESNLLLKVTTNKTDKKESEKTRCEKKESTEECYQCKKTRAGTRCKQKKRKHRRMLPMQKDQGWNKMQKNESTGDVVRWTPIAFVTPMT